jgi:hypothetical protein
MLKIHWFIPFGPYHFSGFPRLRRIPALPYRLSLLSLL